MESLDGRLLSNLSTNLICPSLDARAEASHVSWYRRCLVGHYLYQSLSACHLRPVANLLPLLLLSMACLLTWMPWCEIIR
ncbi:hypothetical protein BDV23DRAFT_166218 [Aspergillus alliaceus]|uniref:Uncharacterized protein n=1 Tax=Petromyces alliaceus TaxID=209559 RepID=A0A5N7BSF3_PETAA|nr:hypothetical protein BDV23DRAFT_166218 [Aspergillus alliaceus]